MLTALHQVRIYITQDEEIKLQESDREEPNLNNADRKVGDLIGWRYKIEIQGISEVLYGDMVYDQYSCLNYEGPREFEDLVQIAHDDS